jgi:hypothetical protein
MLPMVMAEAVEVKRSKASRNVALAVFITATL